MKEFDCLALETPLVGRIFVEASAGTGKTFAIEHVVARLILQKFPIDKILITTFTNAGVRDLKTRIYQNLQNLLESDSPPPYLAAFQERGAKLSLKNALRLIDEAQIYTIHSFCHRMLSEFSFEANIDVGLIDPEKGFRKETLEIAALDVLRMIINSDEFSPSQLSRLMAPFQRETKNFVKKMVGFLSSNPEIPEYSDYKTLETQFKHIASSSKNDIKEELLAIAPFYNKTCSRGGALHLFVEEQIDALSKKEFDKMILSSPSIFELFGEDNRKKSSSVETHPIINALFPIVHEASDPFILFCRVAKRVQKLLETRNEGPNILLETMANALSRAPFKQKVSGKFRALIIDEFQDTDPLQWSIFSALSPELLLVVGDPKQSIYAFRGADLQTFLKAKKEFSSLYRLSSNYRSDPSLIASLNKLFQIDSLFTLSEKGLDFSYEPLLAKKVPSGKLSEDSFQFVISNSEEEETSFSYIASEIIRLKGDLSFAVLVKDRYEAFRLTAYLQNLGLLVLTTATANITEGSAFKFLLLASKIIKSPKNMSLAKELLSHPFIGWPLEKLKLGLEDNDFGDALTKFIEFSEITRDKGLASFLTQLLKLTNIESREDYADLMQITSLILESNPESLHKYLEKLSLLDPDDHPYLKRKPLIDTSKIHIMTSHMSKGLEFDVVFALGTSIRQKPSPLKAVLDQDLEKLRLFYVAATRAKEKLYLFIKVTKEALAQGSRAPIELLLAKLKAPLVPYDALPNLTLEEIKEVLTLNQFPFLQLDSPLLVEKIISTISLQEPPEIILPPFPLPKQFSSFSSLTSSHKASPVPKESDLPPGPETGNLFHLLLEKMIETGAYYDWDEEKIRASIEKELFRTHLEDYKLIVYDLLHAAFHTTLSTFCLKDVPPECMLQEHPFCYKLDERSYMKGFIDLVFLYNNQYYILDWKMNLLPSYDTESIKLAMTEHSYFTQGAIYKEAIERSLKDHPFGNTFYFFLRGKQNGIIQL